MASEDAIKLAAACRNPARIVIAPVSCALGTSYPYGGTPVGYVDNIRFRLGIGYSRVMHEGFGGQVTESHKVAEVPVLAFLMRQWDDDLVEAGFPNVTITGSPSGLPDISRIEGMKTGGQVLTAMSSVLVCPLDPAHKAIYIRRPLPELDEQAELAAAIDDPRVIPWVIIPTRDNSAHAPYSVDRLEHLVIP